MGNGDPNKPRGKMSSYAFFVQTCREDHKKKHPDSSVNFAEFSKKCSERWKVSRGARGPHAGGWPWLWTSPRDWRARMFYYEFEVQDLGCLFILRELRQNGPYWGKLGAKEDHALLETDASFEAWYIFVVFMLTDHVGQGKVQIRRHGKKWQSSLRQGDEKLCPS